ncbi:MAG: hypothetical protein VXZ27_02750, partial [SAR324 cluster bacterium]|nr:hypothetical protein [SAR324 cluster bacterium]
MKSKSAAKSQLTKNTRSRKEPMNDIENLATPATDEPVPNNPDSDGDTMTDGWEAGGLCAYDPGRVGVNPLNGSDGLENPDGD